MSDFGDRSKTRASSGGGRPGPWSRSHTALVSSRCQAPTSTGSPGGLKRWAFSSRFWRTSATLTRSARIVNCGRTSLFRVPGPWRSVTRRQSVPSEKASTAPPFATNLGFLTGYQPFFSLNLNIILPLYTFGKITSAIEAADANVRVNEWDLEKNRQLARMDVRRAYITPKYARDARYLAKEIVKKLDKAIQGITERLDKGERDVEETDRFRLELYRDETLARAAEDEAEWLFRKAGIETVWVSCPPKAKQLAAGDSCEEGDDPLAFGDVGRPPGTPPVRCTARDLKRETLCTRYSTHSKSSSAPTVDRFRYSPCKSRRCSRTFRRAWR